MHDLPKSDEMSVTDKDEIIQSLARLETKLEEREKSSAFVRHMLVAFTVIAATGLTTLVADHFKLDSLSQTVQEIRPQNEQMWYQFKRSSS